MTGTRASVATQPEAFQSPPERRGDGRFRWVIATSIGVGLVLVGVWTWNQTAEQRAIRHLPPAERQALYDRTLQTLRDPCGMSRNANGLGSFCRAQAKFILEFPECDAACSALAKGYLGQPSK